MYFFNQGQALEQYYISIRNTIQLKANSHVDHFNWRHACFLLQIAEKIILKKGKF